MDNEQFHESSASVHYRPFVEQLNQVILNGDCFDLASASAVEDIDVEASFAVERLVPYALRSEMGIFFTPEEISVRCADVFQSHIAGGESFFDPACGSGNLLISVARQYEIKNSLLETVVFWGEKFGGCDINESFVRAAKLRLIALAALRHDLPTISEDELCGLLCHLVNFHVGDYLIAPVGGEFDCIIANPPFGHRLASADLCWSAGKTQLAAIFVDAMIRVGKPDQKILAILPDVLRSGTRYRLWRKFVETYSYKSNVHSYGRFSQNVDVDVFLLEISVSAGKSEVEEAKWVETKKTSKNSKKISDLFKVNVGPVVPHRLKDSAPLVPFVCAKSAPPFELIEPTAKVKFDGTLYLPPFVVVRRTSNPCDKQRLVSSVIVGEQFVAVENHLIIVRPLDGLVSTCTRLVKYLTGQAAAAQIDSMIRCRHLTKGAISSIVLPRGFV
jgi:hypothetical protein